MNQLNAGARATPAEEDKKEVCDFATNHTSSYESHTNTESEVE